MKKKASARAKTRNPGLPVAILAGGLAKRLHPITETLPKALIPIKGKPFIYHQLHLLYQQGFRHIVLCVGHLADKIEKEVGDGSHFGLCIQYSYDGDILRGTGGAIKKALPLLGDTFFVLYGDSYLNCDYFAIQTAFKRCQKLGLMTIFHNAGQWESSNIEYANKEIIAYEKKQPNERMQYIDFGVGLITKEAINFIPDDEFYDLAQLYQTLLKQHQLAAYEVDRRFYEIGSFAGIKDLEYYLSQSRIIVD